MSLATDATEAKRRVLVVHPGANHIHIAYGDELIVNEDGSFVYGIGWNEDEAWIAAAAGLKEERK